MDPESAPTVQPGSQDVVLVLVAVSYVTAQVTGAQGQPISKVDFGGEDHPAAGGQLKAEIRFSHTGPVSIRAEGHAPTVRNVTLSTRSDTALGAIRLEPGRTLAVKITDARTGAALDGWVSHAGATLTRTGGQHTAPVGAFSARVSALNHLVAVVQVAADQAAIEVALEPGATITGTARGRDGAALPAGSHSPVVEGCPEKTYGQLNADGSFSVKGVGAGTCRVSLQRSSDQARGPEKAIVVPADGQVSVELVGP